MKPLIVRAVFVWTVFFLFYPGTLYAMPKMAKNPLSLTVYATKIDTNSDVGKTTATGHMIKKNDLFVALPFKPLTDKIKRLKKAGIENPYWVLLEYNGKKTTAPVEALGPWNWYDNYWALKNDRGIYSHLCHSEPGNILKRGLPLAQAACISDADFSNYQCDSEAKFNSGYTDCQDRDESEEEMTPDHTECRCFHETWERIVKNPAGIDLADGTHAELLNPGGDAFIKVTFLWIEASTGKETQ